MPNFRSTLAITLIFLNLFSMLKHSQAHAQTLGVLESRGSLSGNIPSPGSPSEYLYRNSPNDRLMPVVLLGAVGRPGLYHIPEGTPLTTLVAISGGNTADADLSDVTITNKQTQKSEEVDLKQILDDSSKRSPDLTRNDIVHIPAKKPVFNQDVIQVIAVTSGILGILLSAYAIVQSRN